MKTITIIALFLCSIGMASAQSDFLTGKVKTAKIPVPKKNALYGIIRMDSSYSPFSPIVITIKSSEPVDTIYSADNNKAFRLITVKYIGADEKAYWVKTKSVYVDQYHNWLFYSMVVLTEPEILWRLNNTGSILNNNSLYNIR